MLFVTTSEIAKRFPRQEVFFATAEKYDEAQYRFKKVTCSSMTKHISALEGHERIFYTVYAFLRDSAAFIVGKNRACWHYRDLLRLVNQIDAVFDISGFALGNQWSVWSHTSYLDMIQFARNNGIPFYILPQSFGPFDYGTKEADFRKTKERMRDLLRYPRLIFAREAGGVEALRSISIFENVRQSPDLVLQNRGIDYGSIYTRIPEINIPVFSGKKRVAVIPNKQCFNFEGKEELLALYRAVIQKLHALGYETVIMRHSREDDEVCKEIYVQTKDLGTVSVLSEEFNSFVFKKVIEQFDFAICSRYHSIVHAYKNNVPCIILGWADKYRAISALMGQGEFNFNILDQGFRPQYVLSALEKMDWTLKEQKITIQNSLVDIQKENCFDLIEADMRELGIR